MDAGVCLFDTAEVYGGGESERIVGRLLAEDPARAASVVVATKFMPSPWKLEVRGALLKSLRASLSRLGLPAVDLYQIHGPVSLRSHTVLADALARAHQEGLVKAVGVSNYSAKETRSMAAALQRSRDAAWPPTRSSSPYSAGYPRPVGLLATCAELGVLPAGLLAHRPGPVDRQVLGVQPSPGQAELLQPSDGGGRRRGRRDCAGSVRSTGGSSRARWPSTGSWPRVRCPIPGAKNAKQAEENAGALGWSMDDDDLARLDRVALPGIRSLQSRFWQHG